MEAGGAAWARAGENRWVAAPELIDGDPETVWEGAGAGPWAVAVDLLEWFDLTAITNLPVKCRAVFFDFPDDGDGTAPAIGEIEWE